MLRAEVRDRDDARAAIGELDSATSCVDALAWVMAKLLSERARQRAAMAGKSLRAVDGAAAQRTPGR
jgi:hypothetical protein